MKLQDPSWKVSVTTSDNGSVSADSGIISGSRNSTCVDQFVTDKTVVLTATPDSGYSVTWGGDGTVSGNTCTLSNINADKAVTATFSLSDDNDGASPAVEDGVPSPGGGTGDGNGDTIPDSTQANVTSILTYDSADYATLDSTVTGGTTIQNVTVSSPEAAGVPATIEMPYGVIGFEVHGVTAGETVTSSIFIPRDTSITGYFKKNKNTGQWENVATSVDHDSVAGKTKITFPLTEGDAYDNDTDPTVITDPGGPGMLAAAPPVMAIPTLSEWGMILLSLLLGIAAVVRIRRMRRE